MEKRAVRQETLTRAPPQKRQLYGKEWEAKAKMGKIIKSLEAEKRLDLFCM